LGGDGVIDRGRLFRAIQGVAKRSAPAPIQTVKVEAVTAAGYLITVDDQGRRATSAPTTDEPHRAGDVVLQSQTDTDRPVVHGKSR
jgi:hypothetical protein